MKIVVVEIQLTMNFAVDLYYFGFLIEHLHLFYFFFFSGRRPFVLSVRCYAGARLNWVIVEMRHRVLPEGADIARRFLSFSFTVLLIDCSEWGDFWSFYFAPFVLGIFMP